MSKRKFYKIITYGCQMNVHDSEKLAGMLENMGYEKTENKNKADIILFNTCAIRENAELKVFGKVGSLKNLKKENPELIIGIGGCMMQVDEIVNKIHEKYPYVDLVFGTHNIHKVPELINEIKAQKEKVYEVWPEADGLIPDTPVKRQGDYKAWVTIIQGCNNFCSYCIVPHVRGRERSRNLNDIVKEVKNIVEDGIKEITLLGQNVNSYGNDLDNNVNFAMLLSKLNKIEGLKRIRFMTSHPKDLDLEVIKTIKNNNKICEHFHLPVQSGSTKILKKMNRGYTRDEYIELVNMIRNEINNPSITTDFIVGFPGETEKDFEKTIDLVKKLRFDMAFTFSYSPRENTRAAKMNDQIDEEVKDTRLKKLMSIQNEISLEENKRFLGETVEVLVEGESKNNPETFMGRSRRNKLIIFPKEDGIKGKIVDVKINNVKSWTLYGEIVNKR
ncbi:MAG TPA: tRNA (N6-isopentenyl adenosine(37)-C2)-methylthiotransferase MiaB [Halanaerobiales bacterium]|nr:tRNA (N6-isopentenyl adenosine(37)-C2)-methylthiotransferase MiaB [Halanaerobiales bacterium]